jgi:hypothetical protein
MDCGKTFESVEPPVPISGEDRLAVSVMRSLDLLMGRPADGPKNASAACRVGGRAPGRPQIAPTLLRQTGWLPCPNCCEAQVLCTTSPPL